MTPQLSATYTLRQGSTPLLISVPHAGTMLPPELVPQLTRPALSLADTDWHVGRLYEFAAELGAALLIARHSRYVIDLNRPPDDAALYTDATQTGLCPLHSFSGEPLYVDGDQPLGAQEIMRRRQRYWQPYHDALQALVNATRARHGHVLLIDAHSIRGEVPRLFAGRLPDINVGTYEARSCAAPVSEALRAVLARHDGFSHVFDGRFKGGHITRHYGQPARGVHALQIELAQRSYMDEPRLGAVAPPPFDVARAAPLQALLREVVTTLLALPAPAT